MSLISLWRQRSSPVTHVSSSINVYPLSGLPRTCTLCGSCPTLINYCLENPQLALLMQHIFSETAYSLGRNLQLLHRKLGFERLRRSLQWLNQRKNKMIFYNIPHTYTKICFYASGFAPAQCSPNPYEHRWKATRYLWISSYLSRIE